MKYIKKYLIIICFVLLLFFTVSHAHVRDVIKNVTIDVVREVVNPYDEVLDEGALLLETGDYLLLETGDKLLLE